MQVAVEGPILRGQQEEPAPGTTILMKIGSDDPIVYQYQVLTADSNGRYSTTVNVQCNPNGISAGMLVSIQAVLADGSISGGHSASTPNNFCQLDNPNSYINFSLTIGGLSPNNQQNRGDTCPLQSISVGQPVNVTNGNMWLKQNDYSLAGIGENIDVTRTYNSADASSGLFGSGWISRYEEQIYQSAGIIRLELANGQSVFFGDQGNNTVYVPATADFYGRIVRNSDGTYSLNFKDGRVHKFSNIGRLISQKDRNGNLTTLNYDANNYLTGITDAVGRTLTVVSNVNGTISQISDSIGVVANYKYFPNTSLLKTVTYADGSKRKFEYLNIGGKDYLTTVKDALDNVLETHAYDSQGRATTSEKANGVEKYTLDYAHIDDAAPYTTVTDANQKITKYWSDKSRGRNVVTKVEGVCGCGGSGSEVTNYEYDSHVNLTKKVDALGVQTLYTYDDNGNRLAMTDVLGTENYSYNALGEMLTRTDRMGGVTMNVYDAAGNLLTTKDALDKTTTLTYTALGQLATVKNALNQTTTLTYDNFGRLTQVKDANNKTTNYAYDARARLTGMTNAVNETTNYEYDLNNRLKKVIFADANFVGVTYDLAGRRTQMTDARGNTTAYAYDAAYRLTSMTDALNHTTSYGYDAMSNPTAQTDALGNVTNYEYDDFNRLRKTIYPAATAGAARLQESVTYDTLGNVKTRTDTAGRTTNYDYDPAQRLMKTTDALGATTQFEYNPRSQMTKVTDAANQVYQFAYDALGRQLSQTRAGSTMSYEYDAVGSRTKRIDYLGRQTNYEYDALNRLKKITYLTGADNTVTGNVSTYNYDDLSRLTAATNEAGTVAFTYDTRGRTKTTTDVFGHLLNYGYDANGNRNLLKLDGATQTSYAYDAANRLTTLTDEASQNFTFGYDIANRLISKALPNGVSTSYNYDGMSRLTRLKNQSSTVTLTDNNYGYNPASQISSIAELSQTKNYSYDNVDRLTGMTGGTANENYVFDNVGNRTSSHQSSTYNYQPFNKLTNTATANYSYDKNGNLLSKSEGKNLWRYIWDGENRMSSASTRKQTVRYRYDALGRRVQRYFIRGGSENTKYIYDGMDVVADDNGGTLTKYQNGLGIDDKLKVSTNGTTKYFLTDHLGSTVGLTNSSGAISEQTSYDSFGNATTNLSTRYQYTGREFDSFTGLQYSRARWYDAKTGRFISEDPIGFAGGDINLYGYVWSNPIKYSDPTGLDGWGNDTADRLDEGIEYSRRFYQGDDQSWIRNGSVNTIADIASGGSDLLRVGSGVGYAYYAEDENGYGRAAFAAMDVGRASGIAAILLGGANRFLGSSSEFCSMNRANPFRGKTPQEIDDMFMNKGFSPRGPDPVNGKGGYVNPKTGRSFHIDENNSFNEPPHVDVNRPRGYKGGMPKRKFPM